MRKMKNILITVACLPLESFLSVCISILNHLPRAKFFDQLRYLGFRMIGLKGKGRFTLMRGFEVTPYDAHKRITIDGPSFINMNFRVGVPEGGQVMIEKHVAIGPNVSIECMQHGSRLINGKRPGSRSGRVCIHKGAWIGATSILLADVTVGENAIIAAGSVVIENVAPGTLVSGVPARFVKDLTDVN